MKKIVYCSCCGKEISINDKICSNCGANNDFYEEPKNNNQNVSKNKTFISQPIKKVPINRQSTSTVKITNNTYTGQKSTLNYNSTSSVPDKTYVNFSISSGSYTATFYNNEHDLSVLNEYNSYKKTISVFGWLTAGTTLMFFLPLLLIFVDLSIIFSLNIVYFIIVAILGIIFISISSSASSSLSRLMYDYIMYDLQRSGAKITYSNKSTGTISYSKSGRKNQLSVYRGYNSHANSRYWR